MIRKINKIMALILIATTVSAIAPMGIASINASAAVSDNSNASSSADQEAALATVDAAMIPTKLNAIYSNVLASDTVSQFEECGSLSYTLDDAAAGQIATNLKSSMPQIVLGVKAVEIAGTQLIAYGNMTGSQELVKKGTVLKQSAETVLSELYSMEGLSDAQLTELIETEAKDIPVYKYTVTRGTSTVAQGFAVGGIFGLAANPSDTYNGIEETATYSSSAVIPNLPLSGSSAYNNTIDLTASGISIICDGLDINIMDSVNDKVYAINNPVYNMFQVNAGVKTSTTKDTLNVIDFSGVTNLKGFTSDINFSSQGISTTVLGISLTTSDSKSKNYKYALPVTSYVGTMLGNAIDSMNLGTAGDVIKGAIQSGHYVMIPDIKSDLINLIDELIQKSGIPAAINDITSALNDLSDSLNDLTDALNDKNDDVNNAWDKVFNRFDNEPGWGKKDGYVYYYDKDGVSEKGVQKIDGKTYYFNEVDGAMETGWQIVDGKRCYFDKKKGYELFNQWIQDGDDYYFIGIDGPVKKMEWVNDGGKNYYLKADGKMTRDWLKIDDYWYCFNKNGSMITSNWEWSDGKWYYLKDNGQAATDWTQIGEEWYYFKDPSGEMQTGWFRADGNWYCTNDDGSMKTGWASSKDGLCYLDDTTGIMKKNEWVTINGQTYYFNIDGEMVTGSRYIDGTKHIFNSDGTLSE
ncbi:N-acetylmuramoyl-L-alanine amidase family protein [Clostridium sp.]|uniref:N-acetylmuramoyl-L-alanine amidase family protein n=1 Tax=Clostridium sp. TaxID=1506 RepID=UPI0028419DAA|nr:N-acetylmuramoyl-L-alanine amidase family protein [Clostridium sp.]MDR3595422.1 N-acetylmuramoyl-L-alanine amidase family protein [Clostridium sp.]